MQRESHLFATGFPPYDHVSQHERILIHERILMRLIRRLCASSPLRNMPRRVRKAQCMWTFKRRKGKIVPMF